MGKRHYFAYGIIVAMALFPTVGLRLSGLPTENSDYPFVIFSVTLFLALCFARPLWLLARRHPSPTKQIVQDIRANQGWFATAALLVIAVPQTLDAATVIKRHIPQFRPYYADPFLVRMEGVFGIEPWQVTHAMFGPFATRVIDILYDVDWHLVQIGFGVWFVLERNRALQLRAALSFQAVWLLLGGGLAVLFASVGPCFVQEFYGSDHFAPLMARLPEDLYARQAMSFLLSVRGSESVGGGISAMPSLHVAIALLVALCARLRLPRLHWLAWAYAAAIWIGSVHLGWYYASDGLVAAAGALGIWYAAGWLTGQNSTDLQPPNGTNPQAT